MPALIFPIAAGASTSAIVTASIGRLLLGTALSVLSSAILSQPQQAQSGITQAFTGTGDVTPQSFMLGTYATKAHRMAPAYTFSTGLGGNSFKSIGKGNHLTVLRNISDIPISALRGFYLNGVWFDYELHTVPHERFGRAIGGDFLDDTQRDYVGKLFIEFFDGSQIAASEYLIEAYGDHPSRPWGADAIHLGASYAALTLKADRDLYSSSDPEITFVTDGMKLLDPRSGLVEFTANPAVMIWNLLQSIVIDSETRFGVGYPRSALPDEVWFPAMSKCDLQVSVDGILEPQYRAGYEVKIAQPDQGGMEPLDVIDALLLSCGGNVAPVGGEVHIRVGAPSLPSFAITDDDILETEDQSFNAVRGIADIYNSVAATFPDPNEKWATVDAPTLTDDAAVASLGEVRQGQVNLITVPYSSQVDRLKGGWLKDAQRGRGNGFFLAAKWAARAIPFTTFIWASASYGYDAKTFEIQNRVRDLVTGQVGLVVKEVNPTDFSNEAVNYTLTTVAPNPTKIVPFELGNFKAAPLVQVDADGVERRGGIRGEWDSGDLLSDPVVLDFRILGNDEISFSDTQADGSLGYLNSFHSAMLPNTTYQVRATGLLAGSSIPSPWESVTTPNILLGRLDVEGERRSRALEIIAAARSGKNKREFAKLVAGFDGTLVNLRDENSQAIDAVSSAGAQARSILEAALQGQLDTTNADIQQLETFLAAEIAGASAQITQTQIAYAAADLVLSGQIAEQAVRIDENFASLQLTETAVIALDTATTNRFSIAETNIADNLARQIVEETTRSNETGALSGRVTDVEAVSGANSASSSQNQLAIATAAAAAAGFEQFATAAIDGLELSVGIQGQVLAGVEGNQNASLVLRADGAELVVVSASDPSGPPITSIFLGAQYVFVNGSIQSTNFNFANKTGWRLRQDGGFDFFGDLTRAAFANGELQFDYSYWSEIVPTGTHTFEKSGVVVVCIVGGGGSGAANSTNNTGTAGVVAGSGGGGGCSIIVIPDAIEGQSFTVGVGAGGAGRSVSNGGYADGRNGGATTFSCSAHNKSAMATGGQGGRNGNASGGVATGGWENHTGLLGRQAGGRGTTRFSAPAQQSSGSNSAKPIATGVELGAFWLDHSNFEVTGSLFTNYGIGGPGAKAQEGGLAIGGAGGGGICIVAYLDRADFN